MATKETTVTRVNNGHDDTERTVVESDVTASPLAMVRNLVYVLLLALESLLLLRFLLSLFGANRTNAFADFIYTLSAPFVAPFRGLLSIDTTIGLGSSRFEYETLIAMAVYGLVAMLILALLRVPDHEDTV